MRERDVNEIIRKKAPINNKKKTCEREREREIANERKRERERERLREREKGRENKLRVIYSQRYR